MKTSSFSLDYLISGTPTVIAAGLLLCGVARIDLSVVAQEPSLVIGVATPVFLAMTYVLGLTIQAVGVVVGPPLFKRVGRTLKWLLGPFLTSDVTEKLIRRDATGREFQNDPLDYFQYFNRDELLELVVEQAALRRLLRNVAGTAWLIGPTSVFYAYRLDAGSVAATAVMVGSVALSAAALVGFLHRHQTLVREAGLLKNAAEVRGTE